MRAVGAVLVGFGDFAFAIGAAGMEIAFAIGAEVEARADGRAALRARIGQWFAHQEINHETDDQVSGQKDDREKRPQS